MNEEDLVTEEWFNGLNIPHKYPLLWIDDNWSLDLDLYYMCDEISGDDQEIWVYYDNNLLVTIKTKSDFKEFCRIVLNLNL